MSGTPKPPVRTLRALAVVLAAAGTGLCGCADAGRALTLGGGEINVESPVAPAALAATQARYVTPRFSEIPPAPKNAPSPGEIKRRVQTEVADRDSLDAWFTAHPQMTGDPEGFASVGRAAAAKGGAAPVDDHTAAAEAWAAQVRASAVPPPPPQ